MIEDRPFETFPCGCRRYPAWTDGYFSDNFGEGPRVWNPGTRYEGWTDQSECREGHGKTSLPECEYCGREVEYGSCRWTDCPGNAGVEDTNYL